LKEELRSIPDIEEVEKSINKMKQETAPGISVVMPDIIKALPEKALEHLTFDNPENLERRRGS
jgi:hypothetical protein